MGTDQAELQAWQALRGWQSVLGSAELRPIPVTTNPIWRVIAEDDRRYVLKRLPEYPPGAGWVAGYRVACHLRAAGVPIAVPVVTDDGRINTAVDDQLHALTPYVDHDQSDPELGPDAARTGYAIGAAIGRLDRALADCPWQIDSYHDDPAASLDEVLPELERSVVEMIMPVAGQLRAAVDGLPIQRTVGDCNSGNVLVRGSAVAGFIDCDHLPTGPRIRDLGSFLVSRLRRLLIGPAGAEGAQAWLAVLGDHVAGHHAAYPLSERELAAVVPMMIVIGLGGAHWALHGWVVDQQHYRDNVTAIAWMVAHQEEMITAALSRISSR